ncbi:hypothetical protein HYX15_02020 [Candidatus Woesearchaeota archaeon]|nr:hypothetical protein [Candidatus Woesearchaeota archaeon]
MRKIIILAILLSVVILGCTKQDSSVNVAEKTQNDLDLSNDINGLENELNAGDLENLDLEIDEGTFE